jgi:transcriptional regulator with GAF, ATPase, and Fis domain
MTKDSLISHFNLPPCSGKTAINRNVRRELKTLDEIKAEYILDVLKSCNGKIFGAGGAAEILGLKASTLNSKLKKLDIRKEAYFNQER